MKTLEKLDNEGVWLLIGVLGAVMTAAAMLELSIAAAVVVGFLWLLSAYSVALHRALAARDEPATGSVEARLAFIAREHGDGVAVVTRPSGAMLWVFGDFEVTKDMALAYDLVWNQEQDEPRSGRVTAQRIDGGVLITVADEKE